MHHAERIRVLVVILAIFVVLDLLRQSLECYKLGLVLQEHAFWVPDQLLRGASGQGNLHRLATVHPG